MRRYRVRGAKIYWLDGFTMVKMPHPTFATDAAAREWAAKNLVGALSL